MARKLVSLRVEGLDDLMETLKNTAPREANNILRAAVHGIAGQVRDQMKRVVAVDTGEVRRGIYALRRKGKPGAPVSDVRIRGTDHALMLEHGTSRTKAQPFIVPTVEGVRPKLPATYREQFGKKLEKSLARRAKKLRSA